MIKLFLLISLVIPGYVFSSELSQLRAKADTDKADFFIHQISDLIIMDKFAAALENPSASESIPEELYSLNGTTLIAELTQKIESVNATFDVAHEGLTFLNNDMKNKENISAEIRKNAFQKLNLASVRVLAGKVRALDRAIKRAKSKGEN